MTPLPEDEADALLSQWLAEAGRTLDGGRSWAEAPRGQRNEILRHAAGRGLPIYLQVAFQEARRWRSFTGENDKQEIELAEDAPGVIRALFARLAEDGEHGPLLVERSLALLAAARNGLAEDELLQLLSPIPGQSATDVGLDTTDRRPRRWLRALPGDWQVLGDYFRRAPRSPRVAALPVVLWSRLALDLRPYLTERGADGAALFSFYDRQLREVAEEAYLRSRGRPPGRGGSSATSELTPPAAPAPPYTLTRDRSGVGDRGAGLGGAGAGGPTARSRRDQDGRRQAPSTKSRPAPTSASSPSCRISRRMPTTGTASSRR